VTNVRISDVRFAVFNHKSSLVGLCFLMGPQAAQFGSKGLDPSLRSQMNPAAGVVRSIPALQ
jgi:hypothetical protein